MMMWVQDESRSAVISNLSCACKPERVVPSELEGRLGDLPPLQGWVAAEPQTVVAPRGADPHDEYDALVQNEATWLNDYLVAEADAFEHMIGPTPSDAWHVDGEPPYPSDWP